MKWDHYPWYNMSRRKGKNVFNRLKKILRNMHLNVDLWPWLLRCYMLSTLLYGVGAWAFEVLHAHNWNVWQKLETYAYCKIQKTAILTACYAQWKVPTNSANFARQDSSQKNSVASKDILTKQYETVGGNDEQAFIRSTCQQRLKDQHDCQHPPNTKKNEL